MDDDVIGDALEECIMGNKDTVQSKGTLDYKGNFGLALHDVITQPLLYFSFFKCSFDT